MINTREIVETIKMISDEHLDVRTITMGISLLDCIDFLRSCRKALQRVTEFSSNLSPKHLQRQRGFAHLCVLLQQKQASI